MVLADDYHQCAAANLQWLIGQMCRETKGEKCRLESRERERERESAAAKLIKVCPDLVVCSKEKSCKELLPFFGLFLTHQFFSSIFTSQLHLPAALCPAHRRSAGQLSSTGGQSAPVPLSGGPPADPVPPLRLHLGVHSHQRFEIFLAKFLHSRLHIILNIILLNFFSSDKSELYHSGVRLNPALPSRHTVAVNEGDTAFFYCSFDGQPVPVIDWYVKIFSGFLYRKPNPLISALPVHRYHSDIRSLSRPHSSATSSSNSSPYYASSSQTYSSSPFSSYQVGGAGSHHRSWSWSSTTGGAHPEQPSGGGSSSSSSVYLYGRNFLAIERVTAEDTGIVTCIANSSSSGNVVRHEMLLFVKSKCED